MQPICNLLKVMQLEMMVPGFEPRQSGSRGCAWNHYVILSLESPIPTIMPGPEMLNKYLLTEISVSINGAGKTGYSYAK